MEFEFYDGSSTGQQIDDEVQRGIITVNCGTITSLPYTKSSPSILASHVVIEFVAAAPSAIGSQWTVETSDGSLTINGVLLRSTALTLRLGRVAQSV